MFIKKSEFEELKKQIKKQDERIDELESVLEDKIELLEFKQRNPLGMEIALSLKNYNLYNVLKYIKENKIKNIALGKNEPHIFFKLDKNNHIIKEDFLKGFETKYKFDIDSEILIQLSETKLEKKTKSGRKSKWQ